MMNLLQSDYKQGIKFLAAIYYSPYGARDADLFIRALSKFFPHLERDIQFEIKEADRRIDEDPDGFAIVTESYGSDQTLHADNIRFRCFKGLLASPIDIPEQVRSQYIGDPELLMLPEDYTFHSNCLSYALYRLVERCLNTPISWRDFLIEPKDSETIETLLKNMSVPVTDMTSQPDYEIEEFAYAVEEAILKHPEVRDGDILIIGQKDRKGIQSYPHAAKIITGREKRFALKAKLGTCPCFITSIGHQVFNYLPTNFNDTIVTVKIVREKTR